MQTSTWSLNSYLYSVYSEKLQALFLTSVVVQCKIQEPLGPRSFHIAILTFLWVTHRQHGFSSGFVAPALGCPSHRSEDRPHVRARKQRHRHPLPSCHDRRRSQDRQYQCSVNSIYRYQIQSDIWRGLSQRDEKN